MENVGFGKRFLAFLLDALIFGVPINIAQGLIFGPAVYDPGNPAYFGALLFSMLCAVFYYVGMLAYADGATLGKKIMKIKVVKKDGSPLTLKATFLRYLSYIVASLPLSLGLLWVLWDKEKRGGMDHLAGTKVVPAEPVPHI